MQAKNSFSFHALNNETSCHEYKELRQLKTRSAWGCFTFFVATQESSQRAIFQDGLNLFRPVPLYHMSASEETTLPVLSLEESVQRLKAEILSVDWRLSEKRAELLEAAFICLKQRFRHRKTVFAIIVMAGNVLAYIRKKGESRVPATVDFLKEAMAHIVTFYEDPQLDPEKDKKIFNVIYHRFSGLKEKIQSEHRLDKQTGPGETASFDEPGPARMLRDAAAQSLALQPESSSMASPAKGEQHRPAGQTPFAVSAFDQQRPVNEETVETLVRDLKDSLRQAEELGTTIRQLLVELLSRQQLTLPAMESFMQRAAISRGKIDPSRGELPSPSSAPPSRPMPTSPRKSTVATQEELRTPCNRTELRLVTLGELTIAVEKNFIVATKSVHESKRPSYLKNNTVPLKDFGRFLHGLASQFSGCLATLKNSKLRDLSLPLLTPRGINLPDKPMESGKEMLVLCDGNWCGILLCSPANPDKALMIAQLRKNNGDLWKLAVTEEEREIPLLNSIELLKREGNMVLA